MDAILLCRISDPKQEDGFSLDVQERLGKDYCEQKNFSIKETFRMVETGSKSHKREKFDDMMDSIRQYVLGHKTKVLHLVVEKPDRLTRNFTNREQLQHFVMSKRLVIHYYKDRRILDHDCSPADIFTDDMMTSVSKYIALNIARESRKGMTEMCRNGWFPGRAPLGYKNIREGNVGKNGKKEAKIVPDEATERVVQRIFELRALKNLSYFAIRDQILEENKEQKGKLLPEKRLKVFNKSSVETVLANPFYGGKFFWRGDWYEGKHELIVPMEWVRLVDGRRGISHKEGPVGHFSHLMTCAIPGCGCTIIYDPKVKTNKTNDNKRVYHYYHCGDSKRLHKNQNIKQVNVSEKQLWGLIWEPIANISVSEQLANQIMDEIRRLALDSVATLQQTKEATTKRLSELGRKEDELYEHWMGGLLNKETYGRYLEKIRLERDEMTKNLSALENMDNALIERSTKTLLELCKRAESIWKESVEEQRLKLVKNVCSNLRMEGANLRYDYRKPFRLIAQIKLNEGIVNWRPQPDLNRCIYRERVVS